MEYHKDQPSYRTLSNLFSRKKKENRMEPIGHTNDHPEAAIDYHDNSRVYAPPSLPSLPSPPSPQQSFGSSSSGISVDEAGLIEQTNSIDFYSSSYTRRPDTPPHEFLGSTRPKSRSRRESRRKRGRSILKALTVYLCTTYRRRDPSYYYDRSNNPRRALTRPARPKQENINVNENNDFILYINDIIGNDQDGKYVVLELLGSGTFGQVAKCRDLSNNQLVGIKVIKNIPSYLKQSLVEIKVLDYLKRECDPYDKHHIVRTYGSFKHKGHLCLIFELLSISLYDLLQQNSFKGLPMDTIRHICAQLLDTLCVLRQAKVIHCDLKPENILLKRLHDPDIKVIDFGSSCLEKDQMYTYIQSRFYRSPEVLLGLKYTVAIDMWSFGCVMGELFLGLPLFPGNSEYDQVSRIVDALGLPPPYMIKEGKKGHVYFSKNQDGFKLKSIQEYMESQSKQERVGKKYFKSTKLQDLVMNYPVRPKGMSLQDGEKEITKRLDFLDLLKKVLTIDPKERITPEEARQHPFVKGLLDREPESPDRRETNDSKEAEDYLQRFYASRWQEYKRPLMRKKRSPDVLPSPDEELKDTAKHDLPKCAASATGSCRYDSKDRALDDHDWCSRLDNKDTSLRYRHRL
ncbi:kinase-like domain-containing protein [Phycomyces nitens]|nr:kinase-like domain-containing protein [Phycomyces nitens]